MNELEKTIVFFTEHANFPKDLDKTKRTIFWNKIFEKPNFLLNETLFMNKFLKKLSFLTERTNLLNKRFY